MKLQDRTNTLPLLILIVGMLILAYWAITSLTAQDPLWFSREFQDRPSLMIVYHNGQRTELRPGQPGFDKLARAVQSCLEQGFVRLTKFGLSEQSLQRAYTQDVALEVVFEQPVEIHTWFEPGPTTQMLFLITGEYDTMNVVLLGKDHYRAGAPELETLEPIREAVKSLGFLTN